MFRLSRFAVLVAGVALAFAAVAQPVPNSSSQTVDPPTRVARLAFIHGDVSFVPAGENDWVEAQLNRPLITGDKLWTDVDSRASLEIGTSAIRMDQQTSFDFLNLDNNTAQMELTQGTLNLRVRRLYDGQSYEIDTPTLAFVVNRVGEFRVDVAPDGQSTIVSVIHGGGDVYGEGGARFSVEEGQSVRFNDPQLQDYAINDLPAPDAFDDFCSQRDRRLDDSTSRRYVSEDVIGYQDLDTYGSWNDDPNYGNVWYPTDVQVGWSPYHYGHWGWVGAYGWTWIDNAPWGFAPFHYGRWAYIHNRWGWCPGAISQRAYYAPALVAFIGGRGNGINISIGGPIGWFALGPRDVYYPSYRVSRRYFTNINVHNTTINNTVINNYYGNYSRGNVNYGNIQYANRHVAGAVTAVSAAAFVASRPVAGAAIAVNRTTFANARVSGFAAVAPTRASLARPVAARAIPTSAVLNRRIVAATRPPARVEAFAQRQSVLAKNPGRPLSEHQLRAPVIAAGAAAGAAAVAIAARRNVNVVTQHGAPVRAAAPALPKRVGAAALNPRATPANRANPVARPHEAMPTARTATPAAVRGHVATPNRPAAVTEQPRHLDSSRFAHPRVSPVSGRENPPSHPAVSTRAAPAENARRPATEQRNVERKSENARPAPRGSNYGEHSSTPESRPVAPSRQEYQRPVQQREAPAPRQEYQRQVQQREAPPPRQEYQRPVQQREAPPPRQEYQRPVQQREAPSRQEYQRPVPQREAPPPRQAAPAAHAREAEKKKDDNDHGHL